MALSIKYPICININVNCMCMYYFHFGKNIKLIRSSINFTVQIYFTLLCIQVYYQSFNVFCILRKCFSFYSQSKFRGFFCIVKKYLFIKVSKKYYPPFSIVNPRKCPLVFNSKSKIVPTFPQ